MEKSRYYSIRGELKNLLPSKGTDRYDVALSRAASILRDIQGVQRPLSELLSNGNRKIGNDTLIFNMTPASKCPSEKLGLCVVADKCYAKKAEVQYWSCVPGYREQQMLYWDNHTAKEFVDDLVPILNKYKGSIKFIRFNESGDAKSQKDVSKLVRIRKLLTKTLDDSSGTVQMYIYTARKDLNWTTAMKTKGLTINGSNFMLNNNFNLVVEPEDAIGTSYCGGDCRVCNLCKYSKNKVINIRIH